MLYLCGAARVHRATRRRSSRLRPRFPHVRRTRGLRRPSHVRALQGPLRPTARGVHNSHTAGETSRRAASWQPLNLKETKRTCSNRILRAQVRFVDSLARHLDYDQSSSKLSLLRRPSACRPACWSPGAAGCCHLRVPPATNVSAPPARPAR
jgi:hypothetical protein